jgi:thioredoxin-related protein
MNLRIIIVSLFTIILSLPSCKQEDKQVTLAPVVMEEKPTIEWYDITEARELATNKGKDIFLFVHAPWCPKCDAYINGIFIDEELVAILNTHFVPVMLNVQESENIIWEGEVYSNPNYDHTKDYKEANSHHELVYELGAESIPNILIIDQSLNTIGSLLGLYEIDRLKWYLSNTTGRFYYKMNGKK